MSSPSDAGRDEGLAAIISDLDAIASDARAPEPRQEPVASRASAQQQASVFPDGSKPRRRTPVIVAGALLVFALVTYGKWSTRQSDEQRQENACAALVSEAGEAARSGQLDAAALTLARASNLCQGEAFAAAQALSAQVEKERALTRQCDQIEREARAAYDSQRPGAALALLNKARASCGARPGHRNLAQAAEEGRQEARALLVKARARLEAEDYDAAEALVRQARQQDTDVVGMRELLGAIVSGRAARAALRETPPLIPNPQPPAPPPALRPVPAPSPTPAPPRPTPSPQTRVDTLVRQGNDALRQRQYGRARSLAEEALRLVPFHRGARILLEEAQRGERTLLNSIRIE